MYARNHATPEKIAIGPVVQISDGAVQTTGVTVRIIPDGVAEGDGGGTTAYSTDGVVIYTPTQAETDYTSFLLIAKKTGCIPASITIVTTASATNGNVVLSPETHTSAVIPTVTTLTGHTAQTGDSFARIGATGSGLTTLSTAASISALNDVAATDIVSAGAITTLAGAVVNVDLVDTLTTYTGNTLQTADVASLNDIAATDIVSSGAITTLAGAVVNVDLVDTVTTYTGNTLQTADVATLITTVGTAGDGLTNITLANDLSATMKTSVQTAVDAAIDTAITELTVAAPTATPTLRTGLMLLYMALRNKLVVQTSGTDALEVHNDAGTKIASKALTDDGSDYTEAEMISG